MTAIVATLLGGGWELVAGWILPTALNAIFFALLVLPAMRDVSAFHAALTASHPVQALALFALAVIGGLVLSAFQTPLYRVLEGYSWPRSAREKRSGHHRDAKTILTKKLTLLRLVRREQSGTLSDTQEAQLACLRSGSEFRGAPEPTQSFGALEISLLAERLRRYPVADDQILPTRLGNAIRRFEEYSYDRYRLDIITMWHALTGVVPDQLRKQVDASRASVDFFVCLIYGHAVVAIAAIAALAINPRHFVGPVTAIVIAAGLSVAWYWLAVSGTDEWAAAVRGLVDVGRKPLAESLGLELPGTLDQERRMWALVSRQSRRAHDETDCDLDEFRVRPASAIATVPSPRPASRSRPRTSHRPR
jgi:hypothetical protein